MKNTYSYPTFAIISLSANVPYSDVVDFCNRAKDVVSPDPAVSHLQQLWYGFGGYMLPFENESEIPKDYIKVTIEDDLGEKYAGLYGFHSVDSKGKQYARLVASEDWRTTTLHEVQETLINGNINLFFKNTDFLPTDNADIVILGEINDPVQGDTYYYNGIKCPNFVGPDFFKDLKDVPNRRYDYLNLVTEPKQVREGGYLSFVRTNDWWQTRVTLGVQYFVRLRDAAYEFGTTRPITTIILVGSSVLVLGAIVWVLVKNKRNG